jgi:hypothetical protein
LKLNAELFFGSKTALSNFTQLLAPALPVPPRRRLPPLLNLLPLHGQHVTPPAPDTNKYN